MSRGEPMWQPISALPTIAMLVDEGLRDARERYATLLEAKPKPHVLDDATIARVKRVNGEGLAYCDVYEEQLRRLAQRTPDGCSAARGGAPGERDAGVAFGALADPRARRRARGGARSSAS